MSIARDLFDGMQSMLIMRQEISDMKVRLDALATLHTDTRERVIRIEGFIDAVRTRRLPRGE